LALTRYDSLSASTRQRFMQYEPALASAGIAVDYAPFFSNDHLQRLVECRSASATQTAKAYVKRLGWLFRLRRYDVIWLHCELFPYLPGMFEKLVGLGGKPLVYDYDDAVFHWYDGLALPLARRSLARKLEPVLRSAAACICGNEYLKDYASRFCERCIILPTVVDTSIYRPVPRQSDDIVIGWIGSPSTWCNVQPLLQMLAELCRDMPIRVRVIGAGAQAEADQFLGLDLVEWSEATEIAEVQRMDIGIMPLFDRPFERGKSGYKLIQYMACGLPVVASPVGVNREIVVDGENGFLATDESEWRDALTRLIADPELRSRLGNAGRRIADANYSLASQAPRLIELIKAAGTGNLAPSARPPAGSAPSTR